MPSINPFSFVPLGEGPQRGVPWGHEKLAQGCWSGTVQVRITAESTLLLGGTDESPGPLRQLDGNGEASGRIIIPGSTLAGAVRAIHEALTDSCLRVVDLDYVPVHRHTAHARSTRNLRLAVISEVDTTSGLPSWIRIAKDTVRLRSDLFIPGTGTLEDPSSRAGTPISSGDRLVLDGSVVDAARDRETRRLDRKLNELPHEDARRRRLIAERALAESRPPVIPADLDGATLAADPSGDWVVLVSDTAARDPAKSVWWVAANTKALGPPREVLTEVRRDLARAIEGAADLHGTAPPTGTHVNAYDPKHLPTTVKAVPPTKRIPVLGCRYRVHAGMFHAGMPVWVELDESQDQVVGIRVASLWRRPVPGLMVDRLGTYRPCGSVRSKDDADGLQLCPSCRLFGAASDRQGDNDYGYRGHVRFADAVADGMYTVTTVGVPQLYSPKPTAGQFYLVHNTPPTQRDQYPLANWGPEPSPDNPRAIRGRKFYWAGTGTHAAGNAPPHVDVSVLDFAAPDGPATFTTTVAFDNVDTTQLLSLWAALSPQLVWPACRSRVGGGRPFGWGVVAITLEPESLRCWSSDRYDGHPCTLAQPTIPAHIHPDAASGILANPTQLAALEHLLTPGYVPAGQVRYPAIPYFAKTAGFRKSDLVALPAAENPAEEQQIHAEEQQIHD